jgi:hypothetical protein
VREAVERSSRQDRSAERVDHTTPVEPTVQSPDAPIVQPLQSSGPDDFAAAAEPPRDNAAAEPPRDNIAGKVRAWFRRIALLSNQSVR